MKSTILSDKTQLGGGEVATVTPRSSVAEAPFTGDTGDTGDAGVVTTSPTPAAIVEPSPGNVCSTQGLKEIANRLGASMTTQKHALL